MPDPTLETSLTVGPKTMKNILEHFPFGKGNKTDPQLIWNFHDDEVVLRSLETGVDGKGRPQLVTELTLGATEFDTYDLAVGPVTIAFHLREFNATIAFAEASEVSLNLRFTDPLEPLYISVDADYADTLFVIATSQIVSRSQQASQADPTPRNPRKRPLEEDRNHNQPQQRNVRIAEGALRERPRVPAKPTKVVRKTDRQSMAREMHPPPLPTAEPQPSWAVLTAAQQQQRSQDGQGEGQGGEQAYEDYEEEYGYEFGPSQRSQRPRPSGGGARQKEREKEPLFLPSSQISHLPPASQAAIIESGLGIEHMTAEELAMMLDDDVDLDEFGGDADAGGGSGGHDQEYLNEDWRMEDREHFLTGEEGQGGTDSFELVDDEDFEMAPTQNGGGTKTFLPLFRD